MTRRRVDQSLVDRGLVETRTRAQALILAGKVWTGDRRVAKPGDLLPEDAPLAVRGQDHPWASRGGLKLDHALTRFALAPAGRICLDIGASTGGFTSVLLHHGATRVYAVDVGHGQLAWSLRTDPRVVVLERTNARHLTAAEIPDPPAVLVCDASFIGLQTILPAPLALCAPGAWAIALIKPQFEAGPAQVGRNGVVRDPAVHQAVCDRIVAWWSTIPGWSVLGVEPSPLKGPEGNLEFLLAAQRDPTLLPSLLQQGNPVSGSAPADRQRERRPNHQASPDHRHGKAERSRPQIGVRSAGCQALRRATVASPWDDVHDGARG